MAVVEFCHLYIFTRHNFFGITDVSRMTIRRLSADDRMRAAGYSGDRFFDYQKITKAKSHFSARGFSMSFVARLKFRIAHLRSCVARDGRDVDLNELIGQDFEVQGVRFHGTGNAGRVIGWNRALRPVRRISQGRGGFRAGLRR